MKIKFVSIFCIIFFIFTAYTVRADETVHVAITNENGVAEFEDIPAGDYIVVSKKDGYSPVEVEINISERQHAEVDKVLDGVQEESKEAKITVRAVAYSTDKELQVDELTSIIGETERITAPVIAGYRLHSSSDAFVVLNVMNENHEVKFYYIGEGRKNTGAFGGTSYPVVTESEVAMTDKDYMEKFSQYFNGEIDMDAPITRAEVAFIFDELFDKEEIQTDILFIDVKDKWYSSAIESIGRKGIMIGDPEGTFRPYDIITRAEISAVISRTMGYTEPAKSGFPDVPAWHWAEEYISCVKANGIIIGDTGGTFRPDDGITRHETVLVVNRLRGFEVY